MIGVLISLIEPVLAFGHFPTLTTIGWIAAGLVGITVIWAKGVKPVVRFVQATVRAADALEMAVPTLREIAEEFKPNHGRSLKDQLGRLERNDHINSENLSIIYRMVASFEDTDQTVLAPLKPLEPPWNEDDLVT